MNSGSDLVLVLFGAVTVVCGVLLIPTRARPSGALLAAAGVLLSAGALAQLQDSAAARPLLVAAVGLGLGPALLAYPRMGWRDPVDFSAWILLGAAGVMGTVGAGRNEVVSTAGMVLAVTLVGHVVLSVDRADEEDRVATLWGALAVGASFLVFGHAIFLVPPGVAAVLGPALLFPVPVALVIGVRAPHWVDVRGLIVSAVVFGVAVIAYVSLVVGVVAVLDLAGAGTLPTGTLAVIGALAAATFHPLQVALRGVVDELLFGVRPDPLEAAAQVAGRIGDDPVLALRAIRDALVLPYAGIRVDGELVAESGNAVTHTRRLPLALGAETVGEFEVGLRSGDLRLPPADERVLGIVAPLLVQTLRAQALAADLAASRGHAIGAIADERRRLRRDLHDGLGPTLSGIAFTADAARNSLDDPASADELLRRLRADAVGAIADIRRLVYAMRPPALDELGLVPALRQWAREVRTAEGEPLMIAVVAPGDLSGLPAAVEVAAYRIAVEALTNAARHSGSERADVRLDIAEDVLTVDVRDHGERRKAWRAGVGMSSMRERAAEVGGQITAGWSELGGRVVATLPVR